MPSRPAPGVVWWCAITACVLAAFGATGCGASTSASKQTEIRERIADLQSEQAEHEAELISIQRQIIEARAELAAALLEVEQHKCEAQRADLEAKVEVLFAQCVERHAVYRACVAENEADSTKKTATGCGAGALLGLLFPPAGIVAVAGGCMMGAAAGTTAAEVCGEIPPCGLSREPFLEAVLREAKLDALPHCGVQGGSLEQDDKATPADAL